MKKKPYEVKFDEQQRIMSLKQQDKEVADRIRETRNFLRRDA